MKLKKIPPMALVIFAVCMVSYSGPMIKGALNAGAAPASVAFVRMLASAILLSPIEFAQMRKHKIPLRVTRREGILAVVSALFLAGHYLTWITSLTGTSTFASVALVCTQPLFVAFFSWLLFHEATPRRALPGAGLALLGAVTIALAGMIGSQSSASSGEELKSNLLALAGAVLMAGHWLTNREIRRTLAAEIYTPILYFLTAGVLLFVLPMDGGFAMPVEALPWMAGLIIGSTLLGHTIFTYALDGVSANVVSFALLGEPVGAMIFSMIFFGEIPTPLVAFGGLLTIAGLAYYLARSGEKK